MVNAESALVIILAVALTVLLVLSIVLVVKLIIVVNVLKRIADRAERVSDVIQKTACSAAVCRLFARLANVIFKGTKRAGKKG